MTDDDFQVPFCCYRKFLKEMNPLVFTMPQPGRRPRPFLLHTFPVRSAPAQELLRKLLHGQIRKRLRMGKSFLNRSRKTRLMIR